MEKKVDLAALVGGSPQNSLTGRAPLAEGYEEVAGTTPVAVPMERPTALEQPTGMPQTEAPYADLNTEANAPITEQTEGADAPALVSVDEAGKPSGVLVEAPIDKAADTAPPPQPKTELELLTEVVAKLTKRLEDFGAIPRAEDLKPYVPVVTITKAGNKRTDN